MNAIKCSIIIRSYNEEKHIGKLMDGIQQQNIFEDLEIILVDSGSTDRTVQIAKSKGAGIVQISPQEFSFGRALNLGCRQAKGEFLLFASAHVYPVYNNWVQKMIQPFSNEKVALVYGRQTGNHLTKYSEHQLFKKWFPETSNYNQSTPFCNNANAAIRKCLWEEQPYDELLTGLEDLDWATKIQKKGYQVVYEAHATIVHVHEETPGKIKNRYKREAIALKRIMPKQHISFFDFLRLSTGNIVSDCFHAIHEGVFWKNLWDIIQFRTLQFWGSYQGFKQKGDVNAELKRKFYYPNQFNRKIQSDSEPGERILYSEYEVQS